MQGSLDETKFVSDANVCGADSGLAVPSEEESNFKGCSDWMMNATINDVFIYEGCLPPEATVCVSKLF